MIRAGVPAAIAAVSALLLAACGAEKEKPNVPPARPLATAGCSPLTYGGKGRPDYIVAASTTLQGQFTDHGVQVSQALKLVLAQRKWRAGDYSIGLQMCDETSASSDVADPAKCRRNARAFARNRSVIAVIGPLFSSCAAQMLPILNLAPNGPLALISGSNTYLGLTRAGPGVERGDPDRFFPSGRRSYARVVPTDDAQGAAGAVFAKREGATRAFVLNDGQVYGVGVGEAFRAAAERSGLRVVGAGRWNPKAHTYRPLAERIRRAGADAVYLGGYVSNNGPRLIKDLRTVLGRDAQILGPDGFNQSEPIVEGAGTAAENFTPTIAVLPKNSLPDAGREFATEFEKRFSQRPCCFSVHSAQAAQIVLDAIADSGGSRGRVAENLFGKRVEGGLLGDFSIDRYGDTTLTKIGVYRIENGRLRFVTAVNPPGDLLARR